METENKKTKYILFIALGVFVFYILPRYGNTILGVLLPFILAAVFAHILEPPSEYISEKLHIPKGISCFFTVISFYAMLFTAAYLIISRLMGELSGLAGQLVAISDKIPLFVEGAKDTLKEILPFVEFSQNADLFQNTISRLALSFTEKITSFVSSAVVFVPKIILTFFVTVIATCYFTADLKNIKRFVLCQLPQKAKVFMCESKKQLFDAFSKYIWAYLTIALITFAELLAGLMFIKREYAFLLALFITAVDILPIFGSGAVLLPWALIEYLLKNSADGTKILILYIIITAVRQLIEPRIVGNFIGLYPLTALFCVFAGGMLMGFPGIFLLPLLVIIIKNFNEKGLIKLYKMPSENTKEKLLVVREKYKKFKKG